MLTFDIFLRVTVQEKAASKYDVIGIPILVIVDASSSATISTEGVGLITSDPDGFPWK